MEDFFEWVEDNFQILFNASCTDKILHLSVQDQEKFDLKDLTDNYNEDEEETKRKLQPISISFKQIKNCSSGRLSIKLFEKLISKYKIPTIDEITASDSQLQALIKIYNIKKIEQNFFKFIYFTEKYLKLNELFNSRLDMYFSSRYLNEISKMSSTQPIIITQCLKQTSDFLLNGILEQNPASSMRSVTHTFKKIIENKYKTKKDILNLLISPINKTKLTKQNFDYIKEEFQTCYNLLNYFKKHHTKGLNIMIYGVPGTGKTEFAKVIANSLGLDLFSISENQDYDHNRLSDILTTQHLINKDKKSIILIDEAEDIFPMPFLTKKDTSKLFINRILENNETPVIWISNNISYLDKAYTRRFSFIFEIQKPDNNAKRTIWENILKEYKYEIPKEALDNYISMFDMPPAYIANAIKSAKMVKDYKKIPYFLNNTQKAMYGYIPNTEEKHEKDFSTEFINADTNLIKLSENIKNKGIKKFSCCLYGAPGTGKSAFAEYLANKLGLKILKKRASDIMGKYVGETEQNTAKAFAEAKSTNSLLIFDEADSFLRDRTLAHNSWEVSAVNEMLTQMENHPLPFICTTNFMRDLDQAVLRRFTFKVKYDYLTKDQIKKAFEYFLNTPAPENISSLEYITPGDFMVVKNKINILDISSNKEMLDLLLQEQKMKKESNQSKQSIGFIN